MTEIQNALVTPLSWKVVDRYIRLMPEAKTLSGPLVLEIRI